MRTENIDFLNIHPTQGYSSKRAYMDDLSEKRARIIPALKYWQERGINISDEIAIEKEVRRIALETNSNDKNSLSGIRQLLKYYSLEEVIEMCKKMVALVPLVGIGVALGNKKND